MTLLPTSYAYARYHSLKRCLRSGSSFNDSVNYNVKMSIMNSLLVAMACWIYSPHPNDLDKKSIP